MQILLCNGRMCGKKSFVLRCALNLILLEDYLFQFVLCGASLPFDCNYSSLSVINGWDQHSLICSGYRSWHLSPNTNTPLLLPDPVVQATFTGEVSPLQGHMYAYANTQTARIRRVCVCKHLLHIACSRNLTTACYNRTIKTAARSKWRRLSLGN